MYEHRLTVQCVSCGFRESSTITTPDEERTIREIHRPEGWMLGSGMPHLCPRCSRNEQVLWEFGIGRPIVDPIEPQENRENRVDDINLPQPGWDDPEEEVRSQ